MAHFERSVKLAQDAAAAIAAPLALVTAWPESSPPEYFQPSACVSNFVAKHKSRPLFVGPLPFVGYLVGGTGAFMSLTTIGTTMYGSTSTYLAVAAAGVAVALLPAAQAVAARLLGAVHGWRSVRSYNARDRYQERHRREVAEFSANRVGSLTAEKLARIDAVIKSAETPEERAIVQCFVDSFLRTVAGDRSVLTGSAARLVDGWKLPATRPSELVSQLACAVVEGEHGRLPALLQQLDEPSRAELAKAVEKHIATRAKDASLEHWALMRSLRIYQFAVA